MLSSAPAHVTRQQDHVSAVSNDAHHPPCKSALGDDEVPLVTRGAPDAAGTAKVLLSAAAPAAVPATAGAAGDAAAPCPASARLVPDNEVDAAAAGTQPASHRAAGDEEVEFAASKAAADMDYAMDWLNANPDALARVKEVLQQYDAKLYQRSTGSNVPFWRNVLRDLVGKAGRSPQALAAQADTTDDSATNDSTNEDEDPEPQDGQNEDDSFFVVDLARVIVQYAKFKRHLPRAHPHYAMKCNDSIPMLAMISALGGGFDCASKGEFRAVLDNNFQTAEGIIYAHPCKMINNIQAANRRQVYLTTFDNEEELEKLSKYMPNAQAVLRIATDDSAARCEFSSKFGCPFSQTQAVLERARELKIAVVGVSFHVGSGQSSHAAYLKALTDARDIFDRAEALGFEMRLLDIGGGFPGSDPRPGSTAPSFEDLMSFVRPKIDELFPDPEVKVIAEPGRYFAESPYAIAMAVHSKRKLTKRDGSTEYQYYSSEGKYGSFNCMIYDHAEPQVHVLRPDSEAAIRNTTIFGPTCDGIDWILKQQPFPTLDVGDWIFVPDFGAYTVAAGSKFNGFCTRRIEFISSLDVFSLP